MYTESKMNRYACAINSTIGYDKKFRLNPNSRRLKNGKRGFSLVELIVVILIIAILAVAVFAGGSAAIKKAQKARAISDLHNFQIAVAMTMNENPQIANIEAATKRGIRICSL